MPEKGEWIQLIIFLVFVALATAKQVISAWMEKRRGESGGTPKPPSSGVQQLEQLRRENERPATASRPTPPVPGGAASSRDEEVYDDGSDTEDSFLGDDDLGGERGLKDDSVGRRPPMDDRAPAKTSPSRTSPLENQYALEWEDVVDDTRRAGPPPPPAPSQRRRSSRRPNVPLAQAPDSARDRALSRSVLGDDPLAPSAPEAVDESNALSQVVHPRTEHVRTEHVRTERVKSSVATPRAAGERPDIYGEMNLSDAAADLGMDQLPRASGPRAGAVGGPDLIPSPLLRHGMDLRQALIGQIILGAPRAHQGPHKPGASGPGRGL